MSTKMYRRLGMEGCFREMENTFDPFTIYAKKEAEVVGRVPIICETTVGFVD